MRDIKTNSRAVKNFFGAYKATIPLEKRRFTVVAQLSTTVELFFGQIEDQPESDRTVDNTARTAVKLSGAPRPKPGGRLMSDRA